MIRIIGLGGAKSIYFMIMLVFCLPHYLFYLCSKSKQIIKLDVDRWTTCVSRSKYSNFIDLLYLLVFVKEFRNVFYLRIGPCSLMLRYIPPLSSLYIATKNENFGFYLLKETPYQPDSDFIQSLCETKEEHENPIKTGVYEDILPADVARYQAATLYKPYKES